MKLIDYFVKRCGRIQFLVTTIVLFGILAGLELYITRYSRLWGADSVQYHIAICGHVLVRFNTYLVYIVQTIGVYNLFFGNVIFTLVFLFLMGWGVDSRSELVFFINCVLFFMLYYLQGLRRSRDMGVSPWRMFIPFYMPIALIFVKGNKNQVTVL